MTPTEEQTAEERATRRAWEIIRSTEGTWQEATKIIKTLCLEVETLRLTNQSLEADRQRLEGEVARMKKELVLWYQVGRPSDRHRVRCSCNGCNLRAMLADCHFRELSSREQKGER